MAASREYTHHHHRSAMSQGTLGWLDGTKWNVWSLVKNGQECGVMWID